MKIRKGILQLGLCLCLCLLTSQQTQANVLSPQAARAYLEKINEIVSQYGNTSPESGSNTVKKGLAQTRLLDLDGDAIN